MYKLISISSLFFFIFSISFEKQNDLLSSPRVFSGGSNSFYHTSMNGEVTDESTGAPIPYAIVRIQPLNLEVLTDENGIFALSSIEISEQTVVVDINIDMPEYGPWSLTGVRLIDADTLIIKAKLADHPITYKVPDLSNELLAAERIERIKDSMFSDTPDKQGITLPDTIRVRITGEIYCIPSLSAPYSVETIGFKDYVKHVLPNEWVRTWIGESLRAGAMAVKSYAWYWVLNGGKWPNQGADVIDSSCDQVYNPAYEYASTNAAVDFTWNWKMTRADKIIQAFYRTYYDTGAYSCTSVGLSGNCMGQVDSNKMAADSYTWDGILYHFYQDLSILPIISPPIGGYSLHFFGNNYGDINENRITFLVERSTQSLPNLPINIGRDDFTFEFWLKAFNDDNRTSTIECGNNSNWMYGNVVVDRHTGFGFRNYGISISGGTIIVGISGEEISLDTNALISPNTINLSMCGKKMVTDGKWHHIALQRRRSDGFIWLYIDGGLDAFADGPDGDISFPDNFGGDSIYDPYLIIGASKYDSDYQTYRSFSGWLDEIRISNVLRYSDVFLPQGFPFTTDSSTLGLYHLDKGMGNQVYDDSQYSDGPSNGIRNYGGTINGPEWEISDLYYFYHSYFPLVH